MADAVIKVNNFGTQAQVDHLYKDIGSSKHAPAMVLVDSAGAPVAMGVEVAAASSLLTTQLNSVANGAASALGVEYDNSANGGYEKADFELTVTWGSNATVDTLVELYLVPCFDGTNYADGSDTVIDKNNYVGGWIMRATTAHRCVLRDIPLPPSKFKIHVKNSSGQAFPASGSTVKMVPRRGGR